MGQQCSGSDRAAYISAAESARALEVDSRPRVVLSGVDSSRTAMLQSISDPKVQHREDPRLWQQQTLPRHTMHTHAHSRERERPPPGPFGYADEQQDLYDLHSHRRSDSSALTNSSGAFTDPRMVDRFYDVSVAHVIIAAGEAPMRKQSIASGDSARSSVPYGGVEIGPPIPTWQHMQAIPFPVNSLPVLPPLRHADIRNSLARSEGRPDSAASSRAVDSQSDMNEANFDSESVPSLRWKPKFSRAVSSLSTGDAAASHGANGVRRSDRRPDRSRAVDSYEGRTTAIRPNRKSFSETLSFSYMRDGDEDDEDGEEEKLSVLPHPSPPASTLAAAAAAASSAAHAHVPPPSQPVVVITRSDPASIPRAPASGTTFDAGRQHQPSTARTPHAAADSHHAARPEQRQATYAHAHATNQPHRPPPEPASALGHFFESGDSYVAASPVRASHSPPVSASFAHGDSAFTNPPLSHSGSTRATHRDRAQPTTHRPTPTTNEYRQHTHSEADAFQDPDFDQ